MLQVLSNSVPLHKYSAKLKLVTYQIMFVFQLESHESLLNVRSLNIQFFIHLQQAVSKQIQDCTQHVKVTFDQNTLIRVVPNHYSGDHKCSLKNQING